MRCVKLVLRLLFISGYAFGQSPLDSMFNQINHRLQRAERPDSTAQVFLHVDKSIYLPNENVWFAAYLVHSSLPRQEHHTVYACLADAVTKKIIASDKFVMENGVGAGSIFVPDSLPAGDYQLIAFTNGFLREQSQVPFVQSIRVHAPRAGFAGNATAGAKQAVGQLPPEKRLRIKWYPESGNLIARLKTKVAFEVRSISGKPYGFTGDLLENGISIATVRADETGRGVFEFTPAEGKRYAIRPRSSAIDSIEQIMPAVLKNGYNVSVQQGVIKDTLRFTVSGRPRINTVYVLVHDFRRIYYFEEVVANVPRFVVDVAASRLPAGLCTITVFDSLANPVAERTVFAGVKDMVSANISTDSANYHARSKVKLSVQTVDASGKGKPAVISLAAVFKRRIDTLVYQDIMPMHYYGRYTQNDLPFTLNSNSTGDIEMFLLTKCWTRYRWDPWHPIKIAYNDTPLGVGGHVLLKGKPPGKPVEIIVINKSVIQTFKTDESGYFLLPPELTATPPNWKLSLTVNAKNKEDYSFKFDHPEDSVYSLLAKKSIINKKVAAGEMLPQELPEFITAKKLDTVYVKTTKRDNLPQVFGYGQKVFQSERCSDYVCMYNILNCKRHKSGGTPPVDGETYYMQEFNPDRLITVIYRACKQEQARTKELMLYKVQGRSHSKEFYVNDFQNDLTTDVSATLQWRPLIKTDENGKAEITFYTNDLKGEFICIVQGVTDKGVVSGKKTFRVE